MLMMRKHVAATRKAGRASWTSVASITFVWFVVLLLSQAFRARNFGEFANLDLPFAPPEIQTRRPLADLGGGINAATTICRRIRCLSLLRPSQKKRCRSVALVEEVDVFVFPRRKPEH